MIIGLTGRIGSGKGEIANFLRDLGFAYHSASLMVRREAKRRGIPITRANLQDLGNEVREKEGPGAWIKRILDEIDTNEDYIIDAIRNPGEVEELKKLNNFFLISVDSPRKERYERVMKRAKQSDPKNWEGFFKNG